MKEGWTTRKFSDIFDLQMGKTPSRDNSSYWGGTNTWVSIADMNCGKYIYDTKEHITNSAVSESGIYRVSKDTVIMSFKLSIGKTAIATKDLYTNEAIMSFNTKEGFEILPDYIYYYLKGYKWQGMNKAVMGMTLNKKAISNNTFSYPNTLQQQHIVEELDLLSSIIEKKKTQLKELDNLAQSLFYEMFGDPITNEKGWEVKTMNEVCNGIGDGLHGTPQYDPNGSIAFINGNNLIDGKITITDRTQYVNETEAKKIFIKMDSNTVLLSINGTLGKTAIYNNENVVLGKSACYLRLSNQLTAFYVMALMNTHTFKDFLESNSSKSTIKNVGLKAIRNYKVILPPLSLQNQFASKIESIERQKELIKQSIKEVETLFNSRMDYYFN